MDLNYLFLRQQVERSRAEAAADERARRSHEEMAHAYEVAIEEGSGGRVVFRWRYGDESADDEGDRLISAPPIPSPSS
jgi:hypothetical protein